MGAGNSINVRVKICTSALGVVNMRNRHFFSHTHKLFQHVRIACVRAKDGVATSWCVQAFFGDIRGNQARHTCA